MVRKLFPLFAERTAAIKILRPSIVIDKPVSVGFFGGCPGEMELPMHRLASLSSALMLLASVAMAQPALPSLTDAKAFATEATISNLYEIQAGQLAASKGTSSAVVSFGNEMVQAHTQTSNQLKMAL